MRITADELDWAVRGKPLLARVGLEVAPGSTVGLLGPNGSGKSSLLRVLAGLQKPDRGSVRLDGRDRAGLPRRELARRVAVVTQHAPTDVDMTVRDVLLLGRIPHRPLLAPPGPADLARTEQALTGAGLPGWGGRRWATLSGGERQRVEIARALLQDPDVLLLDEPTNHLDIRHQIQLLDDLSRAPVTVVVALHDLNLAAQFCDRVVLLCAARVVAAGTPAQVLTPARIEEVFGVTADVGPDGHVRFRRPAPDPGRSGSPPASKEWSRS